MPIPGLTPKKTSWRAGEKDSGPRRSPTALRSLYTGGGRGKNFFLRHKKQIGTLLLTGCIAGGIFVFGFIAWITSDLPDPNKIIDRSVAVSTKIYDRTGTTLLYDIHGDQKRTLVELEDIPDYAKHATLTAEDRNFYEHDGISITGIIRSVIKNITTGSRVGGSTLTQQLVKNAILTSEKTYTRKLREIILSFQIERKFSKDEILKLYFNEIPYGSVAYGIEAAAQTYFGKSVRDVTLSEAAILAALPQAPSRYSPFGSHTDALFARQHWILDSMVDEGYITRQQADEAKAAEVTFKPRSENIIAPHFVMYVRDYLTERYGDLAVEQGGLKVITTLDTYKQKIAEEVVAEQAKKNAENWNAHNAAMVAIDPKTGQILAMVGSKDYFADPYPEGCTPGRNCTFDPHVNTTIRLRQPGSSFKPIVYTAAFKKGYTPETVLFDVVTQFKNFDGKIYEPKNYNLKEHGPVTMRTALAGSLNIPAVKTIYLTGIDNVLNLAEELGYTTLKNRSRYGLSLVLGGAEVRLLEHTNAYAALAREGIWHPIANILEVQDKDGTVLESYREREKKVLETQAARQINNVLSDNAARAYVFGTQNPLTLGDRPVAAKTGTTNDYRDAWTMGHTPSLAVGVWVGNSNNEEMKRGADGSVVAAPIWNAFMRRVLGDTPIETFKAPDPLTTTKPVLTGAQLEGTKVMVDKISGKLATSLTPPHLVEERAYREAHDILYYIHKDDPQGDTPPDHNDEQFAAWEAAVQRWAQEQGYVTQQPPTEFDDVHVPSNQPAINIRDPRDGDSITNRNLTINVDASAPRGVARVDYYLNDLFLKSVRSRPFTLNVFLADASITNGQHTLRAIALDDAENSAEAAIELTLNLPSVTTFNWVEPNNYAAVSGSAFPLRLRFRVPEYEAVRRINVYAVNKDGESTFVYGSTGLSNESVSTTWSPAPPPGTYKLYAEIINTDSFRYKSTEIEITVR